MALYLAYKRHKYTNHSRPEASAETQTDKLVNQKMLPVVQLERVWINKLAVNPGGYTWESSHNSVPSVPVQKQSCPQYPTSTMDNLLPVKYEDTLETIPFGHDNLENSHLQITSNSFGGQLIDSDNLPNPIEAGDSNIAKKKKRKRRKSKYTFTRKKLHRYQWSTCKSEAKTISRCELSRSCKKTICKSEDCPDCKWCVFPSQNKRTTTKKPRRKRRKILHVFDKHQVQQINEDTETPDDNDTGAEPQQFDISNLITSDKDQISQTCQIPNTPTLPENTTSPQKGPQTSLGVGHTSKLCKLTDEPTVPEKCTKQTNILQTRTGVAEALQPAKLASSTTVTKKPSNKTREVSSVIQSSHPCKPFTAGIERTIAWDSTPEASEVNHTSHPPELLYQILTDKLPEEQFQTTESPTAYDDHSPNISQLQDIQREISTENLFARCIPTKGQSGGSSTTESAFEGGFPEDLDETSIHSDSIFGISKDSQSGGQIFTENISCRSTAAEPIPGGQTMAKSLPEKCIESLFEDTIRESPPVGATATGSLPEISTATESLAVGPRESLPVIIDVVSLAPFMNISHKKEHHINDNMTSETMYFPSGSNTKNYSSRRTLSPAADNPLMSPDQKPVILPIPFLSNEHPRNHSHTNPPCMSSFYQNFEHRYTKDQNKMFQDMLHQEAFYGFKPNIPSVSNIHVSHSNSTVLDHCQNPYCLNPRNHENTTREQFVNSNLGNFAKSETTYCVKQDRPHQIADFDISTPMDTYHGFQSSGFNCANIKKERPMDINPMTHLNEHNRTNHELLSHHSQPGPSTCVETKVSVDGFPETSISCESATESYVSASQDLFRHLSTTCRDITAIERVRQLFQKNLQQKRNTKSIGIQTNTCPIHGTTHPIHGTTHPIHGTTHPIHGTTHPKKPQLNSVQTQTAKDVHINARKEKNCNLKKSKTNLAFSWHLPHQCHCIICGSTYWNDFYLMNPDEQYKCISSHINEQCHSHDRLRPDVYYPQSYREGLAPTSVRGINCDVPPNDLMQHMPNVPANTRIPHPSNSTLPSVAMHCNDFPSSTFSTYPSVETPKHFINPSHLGDPSLVTDLHDLDTKPPPLHSMVGTVSLVTRESRHGTIPSCSSAQQQIFNNFTMFTDVNY